MKKNYLFAAIVIGLATGCSKTNDFTPTANATAEETFKAACMECHQDPAPKIFELAADSATPEAIKQRISDGNMMMPKFPNIQGESLDKLAEYVLTNSAKK